MLQFLYNLGIHCYGIALKFAALFNPKAAKWIDGRKNWEEKFKEQLPDKDRWFWFHCASLGEFEQARNLIEHLKTQDPELGILLSFFSPSGYEIRKNYSHADHVCYLPLDTPGNPRKFLEILQPAFVCFVKYELWINFIREIKHRNIPLILLSARVSANSSFFKRPISSLYKQAFASFQAIFTQDEPSASLIRDFSNNEQVQVSSDTRYDRVISNQQEFKEIPPIEMFKKDRICIIAGSSWPKAEGMLLTAFTELSESFDICMILAPHEIRDSRIGAWEAKYPDISLRYSRIEELQEHHRILWVDNIGMLSRLYHYGDIAYVGGGWGSGLHNILEAAVFGCPVLIGPVHDKFPEAAELIKAGGCFEIKDTESLKAQLKSFVENQELRTKIRRINTDFIHEKGGATERVISWMKEKRIIE